MKKKVLGIEFDPKKLPWNRRIRVKLETARYK
jgi:hypothetical protein